MTYKFCPHCAAKNYFEIEPKFCTACGNPLNSAVATKSVGGEKEEEDDNKPFRIPSKLEVEIDIPQEHHEKFGANIATATNSNYRREPRQEFAKGQDIKDVLIQDRTLERKSIGGD